MILARNAPTGVAIRHGTAKSVCTLKWNRVDDTFRLGQWMRGRIESPFCDLSPSGRHVIIYRASKYRIEQIGWTVVSRAPYLKAVAYYPDCWSGGWFLDDKRYAILQALPTRQSRECDEVRRIAGEYPRTSRLYLARLLRDGWPLREGHFHKPAARGWEIRQTVGLYRTYALVRGDLVHEKGGWDWADMDRGRLAWAAQGKLWTAALAGHALGEALCLHDFNGMPFQALKAPYDVRQKPPNAPK